MNRLCLIFTALLIAAPRGWAAPAQTNASVQEKIVINSDRGQFDGKTGWVIYTDHVRVDHPVMKLTCDWLTGNAPQTNDPDRHIFARTNVVIDLIGDQGKKWHITCNQAIYYYHRQDAVTNETVTLSGNAVAKSDQDTVSGEPLIYDMIAKNYYALTNFQMQHIMTANAPNSAGAKTNHTPANPFLP